VPDLPPEVVERAIDGLYDRLEADPAMVRLFGRKRPKERTRVAAFFVGQLGGPPNPHVVDVGMPRRHEHKVITRDEADRWLRHLADSFAEAGASPDVIELLRPVALAVVNGGASSTEVRAALTAAAKGDLAAVQAAVAAEPALLDQRGQDHATLVWAAAARGRDEVVEWLLAQGASPHARGSHEHATGVLVSALAVAKGDAGPLLAEAGATLDQFDLAWLGRNDELAPVLDVHATDPDDLLVPITALHHAVDGDHLDTVQLVLDRGAEVLPHSRRLLTTAARRASRPVVEVLLAHGADARKAEHLGPVTTDPAIARLLVDHGLDLDRPPRDRETFLTMACRGDKGRRVELVRALLDLGADPTAPDGFGQTPAEVAERGGFSEALPLLRP
jgi:truncated hemoglobin YjbI/ankyrin repeat protein